MAKNMRKLQSDLDKNLKAIDEVQFVSTYFFFYGIGYPIAREFGAETKQCPNSVNEGEIRN